MAEREDREGSRDRDEDDQHKTKSDDSGKDKKHGKADDEEDSDDDESDDDDKDDDDEEDEDKGPPLWKRPLFWIIAIVVVAVLVIGGTLYWLHARQFQTTDDAYVDAHLVRIAPQVSGLLVSVPAPDNRHVEAGQLLAVVEPTGPEAQRQQAYAERAEAVAGVKQAEAQIIAARAKRAQAVADSIGPEAQADRAARDYDRYLSLSRLDSGAASATQVDQARAAAEQTAGQAASARRAIDSATADIAVAGKQRDAALAQVSAADARIKQTNVTIGDLRIEAPVAGQLVNRMVNVGSYVAPGQQMMAIVPDKIWITANFKETQLQHMRPGQHVDIQVDAFPDVEFEGHVDSIQHGAGQAFQILPPQNATGNFVKVVQRVPVRILFDLGDGRPDPRRYAIGPGMSVVPRVKVR